MTEVHDLASTFAVLTPQQTVTPVAVGPEFYEGLDTAFDGFKGHVLIAIHEFSADWPTWEIHPAGDEIVLLLSGSADFQLQTAEGVKSVTLGTAGEYLVVPRNTWHTARVAAPCKVLFITPGEGTLNQETPGDDGLS